MTLGKVTSMPTHTLAAGLLILLAAALASCTDGDVPTSQPQAPHRELLNSRKEKRTRAPEGAKWEW